MAEPQANVPTVSDSWLGKLKSWWNGPEAQEFSDADALAHQSTVEEWVSRINGGAGKIAQAQEMIRVSAPGNANAADAIRTLALLEQEYTDLSAPFFSLDASQETSKPFFGFLPAVPVVLYWIAGIAIASSGAAYCYYTINSVRQWDESMDGYLAALKANEQASKERRALPAPNLASPPPPPAPLMGSASPNTGSPWLLIGGVVALGAAGLYLARK